MADYPQAPSPPPEAQQESENHATDADSLRRLRVIEERFLNLRRKAQLVDEKLLASEQKLNAELKAMTTELVQMRRSIADLRESIQAVKSEMSHAASQYELKALEKYIGYWEPLSFVTKDELMRKQNFLKQQTERSERESVK